MRTLTALVALIALSACDAPELDQAKQDLASIGGQVIASASGAVDTRSACMLAGQSEAFCGCVQERMGSRITPEHIEAITSVARDALGGEGMENAARTAQNIDPATRDALIQCATHAAVQGALGTGAAEN